MQVAEESLTGFIAYSKHSPANVLTQSGDPFITLYNIQTITTNFIQTRSLFLSGYTNLQLFSDTASPAAWVFHDLTLNNYPLIIRNDANRTQGELMNCLISRILALLFLPMACLAQTATTKPQVITTTAPVVPGTTVSFTLPKNLGTVKFVIPQQTLKPLMATVPGQTAPVSLLGAAGSFTCTVPVKVVPVVQVDAAGNPAGVVYVLAYNGPTPPVPDANGNVALSGTNCSVVTK